jgi:hypothetical protein
MKHFFRLLVVLCLSMGGSIVVHASDLVNGSSASAGMDFAVDTTGQRMVITTNFNQSYVGLIISDDGREVLIETEDRGKIYISKANILSIKPAGSNEVVMGEYVGEGAFTTRYAFTTNALPVKRGDNYAMLNLYGPEVHFAISDNTSLGVMSTWLGSPMALAIKRSFATDNPMLNFSAGALLGTSGYLNNFEGGGGLYFANATYGNRKHNLTVAAGYAHVSPGTVDMTLAAPGVYVDNSSYFDSYNLPGAYTKQQKVVTRGPLLSIGAVTKVGPKASLVFDSMWGMFKSNRPYNEATTVTLQEPNWNIGFPGLYEHTVTLQEGDSEPVFMFFLMPGFRVERTPNKSFQFNLAGVSFSLDRERVSFPFPMCTWFYGF